MSDDLSILGVLGNDHDDPPRRARRRGSGRRGGVIALVVIVLLLTGIVLGGRMLYHNVAGASDYTGAGTGEVTIQIRSGQSAKDIATTLVQQGVVKSERAFQNAAEADPRYKSVHPGFYKLRREMSAQSALDLLLDPRSLLNTKVTIPEGQTSGQVFALLSSKTKVPLGDFEKAAANPAALGMPKGITSVEGFLFPATYEFDPGTSATDMLKKLVATWQQRLGTDAFGPAAGLDVNWYQALTIASLVEEEAITSDFGKVARVVYNRLDEDMRLQFDSTVNYALKRNHIRVSEQDIQVDSPYNTYQVKGLPPTPIANPGMNAINAALHPEAGDWLYFVKIRKDGTSLFTASQEEFAAAKAQAQADGIF